MQDLEKICEYLTKVVEQKFYIHNRWGATSTTFSFRDTVYTHTIQIHKKECRIAIFTRPTGSSKAFEMVGVFTKIPLADPDCFKKFEDWVKELK